MLRTIAYRKLREPLAQTITRVNATRPDWRISYDCAIEGGKRFKASPCSGEKVVGTIRVLPGFHLYVYEKEKS
jgi:hypothetical protein